MSDRRKPIDDPKTRKRVRGIAIKILLAVAGAAAFVCLPALRFNDPSAGREVMAALAAGLIGLFLAGYILWQMARDVEESQKPVEEHMQPAPVLVLTGVDLRDALLPGVELGRSELTDALLRGADLSAATLHASRLAGADLRTANLRGVDLRLADLRGSDLRDADLRGADLRGTEIGDALFDGAIYNEATEWPGGSPPGSIRVKEAREPES